MTQDVVLSATEITKTFVHDEVETRVLLGVSLELRSGELVALMGPSGSGKSTLLNILGTLLRPTSGSLSILGQEVTGKSQAELTKIRNRSVGFVFQFHHLLPDFTALENVMFPAFVVHGSGVSEVRERAAALLERAGLSARLEFRPGQLSGGQKQRVAVARAIMMRPAIVLADEPTGNLDRETSGQVMELLDEVRREEETGFLVCTHDQTIADNADRILTIVDGRLQ